MQDEEVAKKVENIFESASDESSMWNAASKFALQLSQEQIYILTLIKFLARRASNQTGSVLMGFYNDYMELQNNRNTALFIARMAEFDSLKKYFTGIQGQVKIEK